MNIPQGLSLCPVCGEYRGRVRMRDLNWEGHFMEAEYSRNERLVRVSCRCEGIPCPGCGKVMVHRPGSNSYDPETNELWHNPVFPCPPACPDCRRRP